MTEPKKSKTVKSRSARAAKQERSDKAKAWDVKAAGSGRGKTAKSGRAGTAKETAERARDPKRGGVLRTKRGELESKRRNNRINRRGELQPNGTRRIQNGKGGGTTNTANTTKIVGTAKVVNTRGESGRKKAQSGAMLCPVKKQCGGCQFLDIPYERQLELKQRQVAESLKPYCRVHRIIGMEHPVHYRNKVHAVFAHRQNGPVVSGIYAEGSHDVVPVDSCLLEDERADAIVQTIRDLLRPFKIRAYDEDTGYGLLRHVLIRTARQTGQIMVVLVLNSQILPSKNNFVRALREAHPEITTIILNVNDRDTSMVLGDREIVLYGKGYIEDVLCGCRFRISAKSFYQVNPVQTELLYAKALELAGLTGRERVIDAYCGIGTIGLIAAKRAKEVSGVELNGDAVRDAIRNARENGIRNIRFYQNDAGRFITGMAEQGEHADVVIMDPPRAGSDEAFLSSVLRLAPKRIIYISCNHETQARDLAYLTKRGYRAEDAWIYDMFPFTKHVETVCLLSKLNVKQHIEVELTMDEMDLTAAEKKASYEEIKAYVLEKFGMKVSHLYIAQVKRKYGIIERENYNKPKSESAKQPQCPPEKEAAIRAALEYFRMI